MKAEELIRDSLQELGVQAAEQPIRPDVMQTGIRYLNRLMYNVDYLGLGYTVVSSSNDDVTIPPYAEEWAIAKLAIRLAPQFPPTDQLQVIILNEKDSWSSLLAQHQETPVTKFTGTVPVGSGNQDMWLPVFYPEDPSNILTEDGGNILLESGN